MSYFTYADKSIKNILNGVELCIGTIEYSNTVESNLTREIIKGTNNDGRLIPNHITTKYTDAVNFKMFLYKESGFDFTDDEVETITNFLFAFKTPKWLSIKNDDGSEEVLYKGVFTDVTYHVNKNVYGLDLTFNADSPFAYSGIIEYTIIGGEELIITLPEYLENEIYPIIEVTNGTLREEMTIANSNSKGTNTMSFTIATINKMYFDCQYCIALLNDEVADYGLLGWADKTDISWLKLQGGENKIVVTGSGIVTIKYRLLEKKVRII